MQSRDYIFLTNKRPFVAEKAFLGNNFIYTFKQKMFFWYSFCYFFCFLFCGAEKLHYIRSC